MGVSDLGLVLTSPVAASWPAWWRALTQFAYFVGVALVVGGTLTYLAVLRPVLRTEAINGIEEAHVVVIQRRSATLLVSLLVPGSRDRLNRVATLAAAFAVMAVAVISLPTDLGVETFDDVLGILMTQTHIIASCAWLGGLASLALLSRNRHAFGKRAGFFWARLWQRFSIVALTAVGAVIASGFWLTWKHVGGFAEFVTTTYGRFLLVKLLLVLAMVLAGAYNHFLLMPRMVRARAADDIGKGFIIALRHFPVVVTVESTLGICVLVVVPFLTGSARAQAGDGAAPTIDSTIFTLGLLLIASLGATFYAAHRVSLFLTDRSSVRSRP